MTDFIEISGLKIGKKDLNVVLSIMRFIRETDGLSDKNINNLVEIIIEKLRHSQIIDQETSHDPTA